MRHQSLRLLLVVASALLIMPAWAATGRTAGTFDVSQIGSAQYSIPIWAPPGAAGMRPSIALSYNHMVGNNLLGMGWSISGLSVISRCPKTIAQDGSAGPATLTTASAYCLDGNRLRLTSGTYGTTGSTYQTEIDTVSRSTAQGIAGNGPAWWEVYQQNGLIYEYGNSADSRIETVGTTTARTWALNKIRDRNGNYIEFTYQEDGAPNGGYRIAGIFYTANSSLGTLHSTKVIFEYEPSPRTDPIYRYAHGDSVTAIDGPENEIKRLDRIDVIDIAGPTVLRTYDLTYEVSGGAGGRSRLASIQECKGGDCLSATNFVWTNGTSGWPASESSITATIPTGATKLVGDINGDGRDDLVYSTTATSGTGVWAYMLGTATGYAPVVGTGIPNLNQADAQSIEWNGDGLMDVLVPCGSPYVGIYCVMLANGSGFAAYSQSGTPSTGSNNQTYTVDVNGDGRDDLVRMDYSGTSLWLRLQTGAGFGAETQIWFGASQIFFDGSFSAMRDMRLRTTQRSLDFNGDGRKDFILKMKFDGTPYSIPNYYYYQVLFGSASGFTAGDAIYGGSGISLVGAGDFNNDKQTDLLFNDGANFSVALAQGNKFTSVTGPASTGLHTANAISLDYDGDGRVDLVVPRASPNNWLVARSVGNSFAPLIDTGIAANTSGTFTVSAADLDGDGLGDIARVDSSTVKFRLHLGTHPDLLDTATDGFGNTVDFNYSSLAAGGSTYAQGSIPAWPLQPAPRPFYVVSNYQASTGINSTYTMTFEYEEGRVDTQGRGFLGFAKRRTNDSNSTLKTETTYFQSPADYEKIGAPHVIQVKQSSGVVISETTNTWSKHTYGSGATEHRLPYISQQVNKRYEAGGPYDGVLISTATTTNSVDVNTGVVYDTSTTTVEGVSANGVNPAGSYTQRVYHPLANLLNDTTNWCVGRPGQTQYISSHPQTGGATITRTVNRTWDAVKCRQTQEVVEPGNATLEVTTDLIYDDMPGEADPDFGNLVARTTTGVGMSSRTERVSFGSTGRYPASSTNALSQTTTYVWNLGNGTLNTVTDPNLLPTGITYDNFLRRVRVDYPDGTDTFIDYSPCATLGCIASTTNKMAITVSKRDTSDSVISDQIIYTDALDRTLRTNTRMLSGAYNRVDQRYDTLGRLYQQGTPCWEGNCTPYWTSYTYDVLNRVISVGRRASDSDPTSVTVLNYYEGLTTRTLDELSKQASKAYTVLGWLSVSTDHDGYSQSFGFDAFGNLLQVYDSVGITLQSYAYNVRGMRTSATDVNMGTTTFTPNALGEVVSQTDAKSQTITFAFDALSRLTSRVEPDPSGAITHTFTWGSFAPAKNIGKLDRMETTGAGIPSWKETYTYDNFSRLQQIQYTENGSTNHYVNQTYYAATGLPDTLTYPTSTPGYRFALKYNYTNGHLASIVNPSGLSLHWQANAQDPRGHVVDETLGNTIQTLRGFDGVTGRLGYIQSGAGGGTGIQNLSYLWDYTGNLIQRQDTRQTLTENFYYDNLHRFDYSTLNSVTNMDMTYNSRGNITNKTGQGAYTYDATKIHAAATIGGSAYSSYDANGNGTGVSGSFTYSWFANNLPKSANWVSGGYSSSFNYGPTGQRYQQVASFPGGTSTIWYMGDLVEKETTAGVTTWRHYAYSPSGRLGMYWRKSTGASRMHYFTTDHLGSIDSITNSSGTVLVRLSYDAWGARRKEAGWSGSVPSADWTQIYAATHRGYTGHEMLDDLDIIHMNGRMYDPASSRMDSADPLVWDAGNTQAYNRYSYVGNNPLSYTDPSGFSACVPKDAPSEAHAEPDHVDCEDTDHNGPLTEVTVTGGNDSPAGPGRGGSTGGTSGQPEVTVRGRSDKPKDDPKCRAPTILPDEARYAIDGNRSEFWRSRALRGDPIADTALDIVYREGFGGNLANQQVIYATLARSPGITPAEIVSEVRTIGVQVMQNHADAVTQLRGALSPEIIAGYHFDVFENHGVPPSTFGGAPLTGTETEARLTSFIWMDCP